jgi:hypothetical protein
MPMAFDQPTLITAAPYVLMLFLLRDKTRKCRKDVSDEFDTSDYCQAYPLIKAKKLVEVRPPNSTPVGQ